ncbi:hypothetical protein HDU98_010391 [Podochytrium sp. JEL0797]|nr:hypothetical protein HDU98_010391 [Podochytrium sp. JEL0797]
MGNGGSRHHDGEIGLQHFDMLKVVGKGAFGKVRICQKRDTKHLYALKYIDKAQCIRMHALQNLFRERAILQDLHHPFIVNLRYAFQDDNTCFYVLDLKTGGDLRHHLNHCLGFEEGAVRIWAVELSSAIQYLHERNIIHRDIKPDNVLLDERGHAHLTDFNIAVHIDRNTVLKSRSGTLAYLAPEVFSDEGYYWQIDWWGLGILLYELIYFKRPFRGKTTNQLISSIREAAPQFPKTNVFSRTVHIEIGAECVLFLSELLDRNPVTRLGCRAGQILDVVEHVWLDGIDWNTVEKKEFMAKFIPEAGQDNFDPRVNLEEFLMDVFPVEAVTRPKKKKDGAAKQSKPTHSSSKQGSFMGFGGVNTSERKRTAGDAAAVAGNVHAMLKQYRGQGGGAATPNGFSFFKNGAKKHQHESELSENERVDMEMRFMNDHFLPFDSSKRKGADLPGEHSHPAPLVPTSTMLRYMPAMAPRFTADPNTDSFTQHHSIPKPETPMDAFLRSNPLIDLGNLNLAGSHHAISSSNDSDSTTPADSIIPNHQLNDTNANFRLFNRRPVIDTSFNQPALESFLSSSSSSSSSSSGSSLRMFTFRDSPASPLALQAKYDASVKRNGSPAVLSVISRSNVSASSKGAAGSGTGRKLLNVRTAGLSGEYSDELHSGVSVSILGGVVAGAAEA